MARTVMPVTIPRHNHNNVIWLGLFNSRSVAEKSAAIQQWISDMKLGLSALVETWHDDASSPQLIACVPPGFRYVENALPRIRRTY